MKFGRLAVLAILVLGSMFFVGAAKTDEVREIIPKGETIAENHFFSGDYFENNGIIDGDLFVSSDDVLINGKINGNLFLLSQNETVINGNVTGDVFVAAAEKVIVTGRIDGNIFAFGKVVSLESRGEIDRDFYAAGEEINIYGAVNRNANIYSASNILVKGIILGDLKYTSRTTNIIGGSVKGETVVHEVARQDADKFMEQTSNRLFSTLSFIFTTLIIWFLLSFIFKETRKKTANLLENKKTKLFFFYGLLGLLVTIGIGIAFLISYIGIPFGLIVFLLMVATLYVSTGVFIVALSDYIGAKYPRFAGGNNILYVVGLSLLISLIKLIPVLGGLTSLIIVIFGYGLIIGSFYHKIEVGEEHNLIL